jgi:ferredoxin
MQVRVIPERCQGHTLCNIAQPEIFLLNDDDGHAVVTDPNVPPGSETAVLRAEASCPEQAIEVSYR